MATTLTLGNAIVVALLANAPKIISIGGHFTVQPGPGVSVTVEGSLNNDAVQAEYAGGPAVAGTWSDVVGGPVSGGAIKKVDEDVTALRLTSSTAGNVYLIVRA